MEMGRATSAQEFLGQNGQMASDVGSSLAKLPNTVTML
jgi:hypothetical protein